MSHDLGLLRLKPIRLSNFIDMSSELTSHDSSPIHHQPPPLNLLPDSLLLLICLDLDLTTLLHLRHTNQEFYLLTYDESLFQRRSLKQLLRFCLRPPSMRHVKAILTGTTHSPLPRLQSLDVTLMQHIPNGLEFIPPNAYHPVRLLKIRDQSLLYDMRGLEYACKEVFGTPEVGGNEIDLAPRTGKTTSPKASDRGLTHLILTNRTMDILEQSASIGFSMLRSSLAMPPFSYSLPMRQSSSEREISPSGSRKRTTDNTDKPPPSLKFDYMDEHLHLVCYYCTGLQTLILPFLSCHFSSIGLSYLRLLPYLRTLTIGIQRVSEDLPPLAVGHALDTLTFFVKSLKSTPGAGTRLQVAGNAAAVMRAQRRMERQRIDELNASTFVTVPLPEVDGLSENDASLDADPYGCFPLLSRQFTTIRSLSVYFSTLHSSGGVDDIPANDLMQLMYMPDLIQLKLALINSSDTKQLQLPFGLMRAAYQLLTGTTSLDPHPPTPEFLHHLIHGSCLMALQHCASLKKLYLEGWSLFNGVISSWNGSVLSQSLTSITCTRCDLVTTSLEHFGFPQLKYLEFNSCRIGGGYTSLDRLFASLANGTDASFSSRLEELILHQCFDSHGRDIFLQLPPRTEATIAETNSPPAISFFDASPLRHLVKLSQLKTFYIAFARLNHMEEKEIPYLQQFMTEHLVSVGQLLASPDPQLQSFNFINCALTTTASWMRFTTTAGSPTNSTASQLSSSPPSSLTLLDVAHCVGLTDEVLASFARTFPRLYSFDISFSRCELPKFEVTQASQAEIDQEDEDDEFHTPPAIPEPDEQKATTANNPPTSVGANPSAHPSDATVSISSDGSLSVLHLAPIRDVTRVEDPKDEININRDASPPPMPPTPASLLTTVLKAIEPPHRPTASSSTVAVASPSTTPTHSPSSPSLDEALTPYSPAGLFPLLTNCRQLHAIYTLCSSSNDAAMFIEPEIRAEYARMNPECKVIASRWQ